MSRTDAGGGRVGPDPTRIEAAEFSWALGSLCQLHRIPFDPSLLLSQVPPPYNWRSLVQAATALGFKCELTQHDVGSVPTWPVPCLVFLDAKPASEEEPQGRVTLALLARADAERIL